MSLHSHVNSMRIDIVCVVESWLGEGISDAELSLNSEFTVFRCHRSSKGGGVLLLVRRHTPCSQVDICAQTVELLCVDLHHSLSKTRLFVAYLPGTEGCAAAGELMSLSIGVMEDLLLTESPVITVGDFNCPHIDWATGTHVLSHRSHESLSCLFRDPLTWTIWSHHTPHPPGHLFK